MLRFEQIAKPWAQGGCLRGALAEIAWGHMGRGWAIVSKPVTAWRLSVEGTRARLAASSSGVLWQSVAVILSAVSCHSMTSAPASCVAAVSHKSSLAATCKPLLHMPLMTTMIGDIQHPFGHRC